MRFDLTADQRLLRSATAEFLEKFCPVSVARALHDAGRSFDRETWRRGAELGWTSLMVGEVVRPGPSDYLRVSSCHGRVTNLVCGQ
jgi:alkylation response protein AidB-like acyl-CoA dehydrogenase